MSFELVYLMGESMNRGIVVVLLVLVGVLLLFPLGLLVFGISAVNPIAVIASSVLGLTLIMVGFFGDERARRMVGDFILWLRA